MIIICIILVIGIAAGAFVGYEYINLIGKTEIKSFETENASFKVAVISDTQIPPTEEALKNDDTYLQNLKKALTVIKNNN